VNVQAGLGPDEVAHREPAVGVAFGDLVAWPDVGAGGVDPHAQQPARPDPRLCRAQVGMGGAAVAVLEHLDAHHQRPPPLGRQDGQITVDELVRTIGPARPELGDRLGGDVQTGHVHAGVAIAIADQLRTLHANIVAQAEPGPAGLEQIVRWYLSAHHRDNPGDGCPNAALLDEIGRCADPTRQAYTDGVLVVIDGLAARMAPDDPPSARVTALSLLGLMAGTLQLSRALTDRRLADDLLAQGLRTALALLDSAQRRNTRAF
jgi:hypothetical protein